LSAHRTGVRHEREPGKVSERPAIPLVDLATAPHHLGESAESAAADGGEEFAEPVVESDLGVLEVRGGIASLGREVTSAGGPFATVRHEHAATTRRDHLVAVEGEHPDRTEGAGGAPGIGRAERLRRILDDRHAVALARYEDRLPVGALAEEIDANHRRRGRP